MVKVKIIIYVIKMTRLEFECGVKLNEGLHPKMFESVQHPIQVLIGCGILHEADYTVWIMMDT